jgi:signal transduction histidine kinase/ActR/RegA family two-component response regulator
MTSPRGWPLALKIAVLAAMVTSVVVSVAMWFVTDEIARSTRERALSDLARNQRVQVQTLQRRLEQLSQRAALISRTARIPYVLATVRAEALAGTFRRDLVRTVQSMLEETARQSGSDLLLVTDERGRVVASASSHGPGIVSGTDLSGTYAVRHALDPQASIDTASLAVLHDAESEYQVAVFPVDQSGYTVGTLAVGERLDSGFVAAARASFAGSIVLIAGPRVLSGVVAGVPNDQLPSLLTAKAPTVVTLGADEFVVAPLPLGTALDRSRVVLWLVQPLGAEVRALTQPLTRRLLWYGILAVLIAAVVASALARAIVRPLDRFILFLREGRGRSNAAPFNASGAPIEVQSLDASFSFVMASLADERLALEARTTQLAAVNDALRSQIEERARIEEALRQSEAALRQSQKLEAVGTLAGGVAHDFNNLLTAISGFAQLAQTSLPKEDPAVDDMKQVIAAAGRATALTRQLLAFSRKQVLEPTVLDVADVVDDVAPILRRLIGAHLSLEISHAPSRPRISADRGQLEQVIINLVVNARDAMPQGGRIVISTEVHADGIALVVRDTGSGIPPEIRDRIFEPFFTTKAPGKGTGLGLSMVYGIVKQSGGTLTVQSVVGEGTTFRIALPKVDDVIAGRHTPSGTRRFDGGTERVLLVEDEPGVRAFVERALESLGYRVHAASLPSEALAIAARVSIDLLLADIVLPEILGPSLARQLRASLPELPVLFMSGYEDDALATFDIDAQTRILRKPFTPIDLAIAVRDALDNAPRNEASNA